MDNLIKALGIFSNYTRTERPTEAWESVLYVVVSPRDVSPDDTDRLKALGFEPDAYNDRFKSDIFGSH